MKYTHGHRLLLFSLTFSLLMSASLTASRGKTMRDDSRAAARAGLNIASDAPYPSRLYTSLGLPPVSAPVAARVLPVNAGDVIISEFRLSGPAGPTDEFVELYNNTEASVTVASSDASAGWAVVKMGATCADSPVVVGVIPNGTVIPARGHYLFVGAQYSLADHAAGDRALTADIGENINIGLFNTSHVSNLSTTTRLDAVGFAVNTGGNTCDLLKEGNPLPAVDGGVAGLAQHSFYRSLYSFVPGVGPTVPHPGFPSDRNDNAVDFLFVDTNATNATGLASQHRLGAPGPESLASPKVNDSVGGFLLDATKSSSVTPNRVRRVCELAEECDPNRSQFGTMSIRRRFTNSTGANVTRLRFRVAEVTTFPRPDGATADVRAISSGTVTASNVGDSVTCAANGAPAPCTITVQGTTLEEPPNQLNGGGYNSSMAAGTITLGTPLANGESISLQFMLGVQQTGSFRFLLTIEAITLAPNAPPTVAITQPAPGAVYNALANISITASADDSDGSVSRVEFFRDGSDKIGEALTSPYTITWNNVGAGTFSLTARATDNSGASNTSAPVTVTVNEPAATGPHINGISPASGPVGTPVTINGTNFGAVQGSSSATFNGGVADASPARRENGKMIYISSPNGNTPFQLYSMNADGTGQTKLTNSSGGSYQGRWSPDGSKVVYTHCNPNCEIYVMNTDGSSPTQLTNDAASDDSPQWSPDGSKIAFASDRSGNNEIYTMNPDGGGLTRVTTTNGDTYTPEWSPGGDKIAYEVYGSDNMGDIYVADARGGGETNLTSTPDDEWWPSWSPDGTRITFVSDRQGSLDVYLMNSDGSGQVRLTSSPSYDGRHAWAPDGSKIAFYSSRDNQGLYLMNPDGTDQVLLAEGNILSFVWSPDGSRIAITIRNGNGWAANIRSVNVDASNPATLTNDAAYNLITQWQPVLITTPASWSATSITVAVPPGATTGPVVVTVNGVQSNAVPFVVTSVGDSDGDGLPDSWEQQYFGNLGQGADGDPDGDGLTNLQEYRQGRNPAKGAAIDSGGIINLKVFTPLERR